MSDIPKMLRSEALIADEDWTGIYGISPNLAFAAADRIEKLEAENAELQSKVGTVRLAAKYAAKIRDDRIEKLEAALRLYSCDCDRICSHYSEINECGHTARTALAGEKKDD